MAHTEIEDSQRLDKWLWAARFYKTRSLASDAIAGGKVHVNNQRVKPSKEIKQGAVLTINKDQLTWKITVIALSKQRLPAKDAVLLYQEDEQAKAKREADMALSREQRFLSGFTPSDHRPNKKERRLIHRFKENS